MKKIKSKFTTSWYVGASFLLLFNLFLLLVSIMTAEIDWFYIARIFVSLFVIVYSVKFFNRNHLTLTINDAGLNIRSLLKTQFIHWEGVEYVRFNQNRFDGSVRRVTIIILKDKTEKVLFVDVYKNKDQINAILKKVRGQLKGKQTIKIG